MRGALEQPESPQKPGPSVDTRVHSANSVGPSALAPGRVSWFWLAAGARRGRSWKSPVPAPEEAIWAASEALGAPRSEAHTSELQSLMRTSYAVFCLKKKNTKNT